MKDINNPHPLLMLLDVYSDNNHLLQDVSDINDKLERLNIPPYVVCDKQTLITNNIHKELNKLGDTVLDLTPYRPIDIDLMIDVLIGLNLDYTRLNCEIHGKRLTFTIAQDELHIESDDYATNIILHLTRILLNVSDITLMEYIQENEWYYLLTILYDCRRYDCPKYYKRLENMCTRLLQHTSKTNEYKLLYHYVCLIKVLAKNNNENEIKLAYTIFNDTLSKLL